MSTQKPGRSDQAAAITRQQHSCPGTAQSGHRCCHLPSHLSSGRSVLEPPPPGGPVGTAGNKQLGPGGRKRVCSRNSPVSQAASKRVQKGEEKTDNWKELLTKDIRERSWEGRGTQEENHVIKQRPDCRQRLVWGPAAHVSWALSTGRDGTRLTGTHLKRGRTHEPLDGTAAGESRLCWPACLACHPHPRDSA